MVGGFETAGLWARPKDHPPLNLSALEPLRWRGAWGPWGYRGRMVGSSASAYGAPAPSASRQTPVSVAAYRLRPSMPSARLATWPGLPEPRAVQVWPPSTLVLSASVADWPFTR